MLQPAQQGMNLELLEVGMSLSWAEKLVVVKCKNARKERRRADQPRWLFRPALEVLEERRVPSLVTLASFNSPVGAQPYAGLIRDGSGNLFGTTYEGGTSGDGTVFEVAAGTNTLTTLVSFNGTNGANPYAGVIEDSNGNLFGTTQGVPLGDGTVFKVAAGTTTLTTLASFSYATGHRPAAGLIEDGSGNLFGTTPSAGAYGYGTIF